MRRYRWELLYCRVRCYVRYWILWMGNGWKECVLCGERGEVKLDKKGVCVICVCEEWEDENE